MSNVTAWTRKHFTRSCNAGRRSRKKFQKFWPVAAWNLKPRVKILTRKPSQCAPANIKGTCCTASETSSGFDPPYCNLRIDARFNPVKVFHQTTAGQPAKCRTHTRQVRRTLLDPSES